MTISISAIWSMNMHSTKGSSISRISITQRDCSSPTTHSVIAEAPPVKASSWLNSFELAMMNRIIAATLAEETSDSPIIFRDRLR